MSLYRIIHPHTYIHTYIYAQTRWLKGTYVRMYIYIHMYVWLTCNFYISSSISSSGGYDSLFNEFIPARLRDNLWSRSAVELKRMSKMQ